MGCKKINKYRTGFRGFSRAEDLNPLNQFWERGVPDSPNNFLDSSLIPQKDVLKYFDASERCIEMDFDEDFEDQKAHCEQSTALSNRAFLCKIFQVVLKSRPGRSSGMTTRQPWLGRLDGHVKIDTF